uniref:Uncharacterized protein n=1 Tax=Sus scrofa TaxID=9823 RepID=A0A4X1UUT9_PIG
ASPNVHIPQPPTSVQREGPHCCQSTTTSVFVSVYQLCVCVCVCVISYTCLPLLSHQTEINYPWLLLCLCPQHQVQRLMPSRGLVSIICIHVHTFSGSLTHSSRLTMSYSQAGIY